MDILNELYLHERQEIMAEITVQGFIASQEGFFDGTKAVFGAVKGATQGGKSTMGKIGDSNIFNAIKKAIDEFFKMLQNITKSILNGTTKLKKLLKDIEAKENRLAPRQDGKEKKQIKTPLLKDLEKMGFSRDENSQLGQWTMRFREMKENGTVREKMDFSTIEKTEASLLELARGNTKNTQNESKTGFKWRKYQKLKNIRQISSEEFGRVIKERYGFGYTATMKAGRSNKELAAQYFKNPPVSSVKNEDGSAFEIIKETLQFVKEAATMLINENIDPYLQEELKFIQKTQKEVEKLNRENIKGGNDSKGPGEEESVVNSSKTQDGANNFFNSEKKASGQGYSLIDNYLLMEAIKAYGEKDDQNNQDTGNTGNSSGSNNTNGGTTSSSAEDQAKRAQGAEPDKSEHRDTKLGNDGSAINGLFEYIRAFLINYAIAIHKTMNFYNAFIMNLYTAGQRLLNDLSSISVNGNV